MIDDRAARGFIGAEHYEAFRPSYPAAAADYIRQTGRLDERSTMVDLGAGTGLMTRLLRPVERLLAIEPVPAMRDVLRKAVPEAEVMDGTAGEIPLPSAAADMVLVAQAFHWFADRDAVREIARVLKPEGLLALVWNTRDSDDPFMEQLYTVLAPYRLDSPGYDSTPWRKVFDGKDAPLGIASHKSFPWEESLTLAHLKGRVRSTSYIALLETPVQVVVMRELEALVGSEADDAPVSMRHRTEVFIARR